MQGGVQQVGPQASLGAADDAREDDLGPHVEEGGTDQQDGEQRHQPRRRTTGHPARDDGGQRLGDGGHGRHDHGGSPGPVREPPPRQRLHPGPRPTRRDGR